MRTLRQLLVVVLLVVMLSPAASYAAPDASLPGLEWICLPGEDSLLGICGDIGAIALSGPDDGWAAMGSTLLRLHGGTWRNAAQPGPRRPATDRCGRGLGSGQLRHARAAGRRRLGRRPRVNSQELNRVALAGPRLGRGQLGHDLAPNVIHRALSRTIEPGRSIRLPTRVICRT